MNSANIQKQVIQYPSHEGLKLFNFFSHESIKAKLMVFVNSGKKFFVTFLINLLRVD